MIHPFKSNSANYVITIWFKFKENLTEQSTSFSCKWPVGGAKHRIGRRHQLTPVTEWTPVTGIKRSSVTIVVYAESQNDIDTGIQSLENLLNKDFHKKEFQDRAIHDFTASQVCLRLYWFFSTCN